MDDWQPTMNLRFVERTITEPLDAYTSIERTVRVLQQEWEHTRWDYGNAYRVTEWRDVPLEVEGE